MAIEDVSKLLGKATAASMTPEEILKVLKDRFGEALKQAEVKGPEVRLKVIPTQSFELLQAFYGLGFEYLNCLSGVDWPGEGELEVVYNLSSLRHKHKAAVKVRVPRDNPVVRSVVSIWKTANWHEREAYDLLGIHFEGHPDLRRILTSEDWVGHPLRKDYEDERLVRYHFP
jgi:NADH-quinone oxidoreductase subunit C